MMIASAPTQEQVDAIARELAPDVVRIRFKADFDWYGDPALHFRVILSDEASRSDGALDTTQKIRERVKEGLKLSYEERLPYFRFRSESEQAKMKEAIWE